MQVSISQQVYQWKIQWIYPVVIKNKIYFYTLKIFHNASFNS